MRHPWITDEDEDEDLSEGRASKDTDQEVPDSILVPQWLASVDESAYEDVADENSVEEALEERAAPLHVDKITPFKILLAEDNIINQRLAVKMLEKYQHVVTVVGNGLEAFEAVQASSFDVVLMDVQMPVMVRHIGSIHRPCTDNYAGRV